MKRISVYDSLVFVMYVAMYAALAAYMCAALAAYNPPPGGNRLESLTSPTQMTSASSTAGGALFTASPESITVNPAIIGDEQRAAISAGYTALVSFGENFGSGFSLGAMMPTPWCVGAALVRGVFSPFDDMDTGNTVIGSFALGKMVLSRLRIGASATGGALWSAGWSWMMTTGIGAIYDVGDVAFLHDLRLAGSLTDFGKTFSPDDIPGIDDDREAKHFPTFFTPRAGAAATLFETGGIKGGLSIDTAFPGLMDFVLSAGYSMTIKENWIVSVAQTIDLQEFSEGCVTFPAISCGYKFRLKSSADKMKSKGWGENDATVTGGWQSLYGGVQAFSAGAVVNLGMKDTEGPSIKME